MAPRKIIIDTDPGQDDAVAILLALASPDEIDLLGITAVGLGLITEPIFGRPGPLQAFADHQQGGAGGRDVEMGLLDGPGKIEQVGFKQDQGAVQRLGPQRRGAQCKEASQQGECRAAPGVLPHFDSVVHTLPREIVILQL